MFIHPGRTTLFLLLLIYTLPLCALDTPELDPLSTDVQAFVSSSKPSAEESRRLLHRIHLAEATYESPDLASRKEAGKQKLEQLRAEVAKAGKLASLTLKAAAESSLETGGLRGRVVDNFANPVLWARIEVYSLEGFFVQNAATDPDGRYSLELPPASYYLYVDAEGSGLSPQIYPEIHCPIYICGFEDATPVQVVSGNQLNVDFELIPLGAIEGRVLRHEDGTPILQGSVSIFTDHGLRLSVINIQDGNFRFGGLQTGTYYIGTSNMGDRVGHVYRDVVCPANPFEYEIRCGLDQATPIEVVAGVVTNGIDLRLRKAAAIEGRVLSQRNLAPLAGAAVAAYDSQIRWMGNTYTDANGNYRLEGLSPGLNWVLADLTGSTPQVYRLVDCAFATTCFDDGQPLQLQLGETRTGIDFELKGTGTLTGQVFDEDTGAPIPGAYIEISPVETSYVWGIASSDSAGYYSFSNLPAVRYNLRAISPSHVDEYFDNVDVRRGVAAATIVQIEPERIRSGIDFRLKKTGTIAFKVVSAESGLPIPSCFARVIPVGNQGGGSSSGICQADGSLLLENMDTGFYYVQVEGFDTENAAFLYGTGSCNPVTGTGVCDLTRGTPIEVKSDQTSGVFDIRLERSGQISLQVFLNGNTWPTGTVLLYEELSELYNQGIWISGQNIYYPRLRPGRYRLAAQGAPNWQNVTWPGRPCNRWYCDPADSDVIEVRAGWNTQLTLNLQQLSGYTGCVETDNNLCLNLGRFQVRAFWKDFQGQSGQGTARKITDETGYFYFFSPSNVEVMIKLLNGCPSRLGNRFWAFAAGLTNVEVELEVTDTLTGNVERYRNGLSQTFQPILDIDAFATCNADETAAASISQPDSAPTAAKLTTNDHDDEWGIDSAPEPGSVICVPTSTAELCLGNKFKVSAQWRTPDGQTGFGSGFRITDDTAAINFFSQSNIELVVKILDACQTQLPGYWVFASGLTDVEVDLRIQDVETGQVQTYHQEPGPFRPILDLNTFSCN